MRLIHLTNQHWGGGSATGVPRFSRYFHAAFPEAVCAVPSDLPRLRPQRGDVIVTDNHLSLLCPPGARTIGVHHGCAQTHFDRDPSWRGAGSKTMCQQQRSMFNIPNRIWVAPSRWVADEFRRIAPPTYRPLVIPHWVPLIARIRRPAPEPPERPLVIGHWANVNKGADVIDAIREAIPSYEFRQLDFPPADDEARRECYRQADAYLCLSMSEGAPYAVADAEAAGLPIVTTEVGNYLEFRNVTPVTDRSSPEQIKLALDSALDARRLKMPSFYEQWSFEKWKGAWEEVITA